MTWYNGEITKMKFLNYINENKYLEIIKLVHSRKKALALEKMIEILEKDCRPFLNEWKRLGINDFLYSGRVDYKTFTKKTIRKDRQPLNTPEAIHQIIDNWFNKKFGVKARSNSMFCSFDMDMIETYGYEHFVFPIGQYKVISSADVGDLFIDLHKYVDNKGKGSIDRYFLDRKLIELKDIVYEFLKNAKYKEGLQRHNNEIMLICKDVYLMGWNDFYEKELLKHFK